MQSAAGACPVRSIAFEEVFRKTTLGSGPRDAFRRLRRQRQTLRCSAEVLPRLATSSYSTVCPSLSVERPAFSTAEICTNTSLPPVEGWMNPNPLVGLNHFTVPLAITSSPQD